MKHHTTPRNFCLLLLAAGFVLLHAPSGNAQDPGPVRTLGAKTRAVDRNVSLTVTREAGTGTPTVTWDANAAGFFLQSVTSLGPNRDWAVVGSADGAGSYSVPAGNDTAGFFRLVVPTPLTAAISSCSTQVNVPELQVAERIPARSLTVLIQPEAAMVEIGGSATFAALVDGIPVDEQLQVTFNWQINTNPVTAVVGTTNLTWRDLRIGDDDNNFQTVPDSPTNLNFFTLPSVTTNDVAFYRVVVTHGTNTAISDAAPLWAWQVANSVIVYGTAVSQSGSASCGFYNYRTDFGGHWPLRGSPSYCARLNLTGTIYGYASNGVGGSGCGTMCFGSVNVNSMYYFTGYTETTSRTVTINLDGFRY